MKYFLNFVLENRKIEIRFVKRKECSDAENRNKGKS